jgi:hypothetical protein
MNQLKLLGVNFMSITSQIGKSLRNRDWGAAAIDVGVVAIGILMALTVDQLFTERQERATEKQLLSTIVSDLRFSAEDLRRDSEFTLFRHEVLKQYLSYKGEATIPADFIQDIGMAANVTSAYTPTVRAYNSMISTGSLTLIKSTDILMALADISRDIENYQNYRNQTTNVWLFTLMPIWLETIEGPASAEHYLNALESRRFFAATGQRATFLMFTGENGIALVEKMTETIALVEQELLDHQ